MRRTSEGLLLLLLATGFAALASTGRLGWVVMALAAAAYLARGVMFLWRWPVRWSSRAWSIVLLAYLPVFVWDGMALSHSFVAASLHLVVLAGAARIFAPHAGRDDFLLGLLAFLEVLTAALLTVSGTFFLLFLLFLVLLVATVVSCEMRRAQEAEGPGHAAPTAATPQVVPPRLLRFSLLLTLLVGGCGVLVFFLLPRATLGGWAARPLDSGLTGFSDDVRLGAIADLQRSNRPVMHIRVIDSDPPLSPAAFQLIPWRGRGLTSFNGRRWFDPEGPSVFGTPSGRIQVGERSAASASEIVRYEVTLEPLRSPVLFFPPRLLRAATHFPVLSWERYTDTLAGMGAPGGATAYSGVSDLAVARRQDLRLRGGWRRSDFPLRRYLQLPADLDPRIPALARRIVADVPADNLDRMKALSNYLRTHYRYSLENLPQGPHPLAAFLFDVRSGDCEYFASALAVLARVLDIPTRLVNGFLIGRYNPLTGEYLVRGSDAHTWVEAYFPTSYQGRADGFGRATWLTFDATPSAAASGASMRAGSGMLLDALSSTWQQWIVNYDWFRQARLAAVVQRALGSEAAAAWQNTSVRAQATWSQIHAQAEDWRSSPWTFWGFALLVLCLIALATLTLRRRPFERSDYEGAMARRQARSAYRRLRHCLARVGVAQHAGQTAEELLAAVARRRPSPPLEEALRQYLDDYQEVRFGPVTRGALVRLRTQWPQLRRLCRAGLR
ncbi:MAG: transglutaminase TgpA family protein [Terriglobales bacterium]